MTSDRAASPCDDMGASVRLRAEMADPPETRVPMPDMQEYGAFEEVERCDLCGDSRFMTKDAGAAVVECRRCQFRFVTPRPTQAEIARSYSAAGDYNSWIAVDRARQALWARRWQRVRPLCRPGRLLDVGAGLGTFLDLAHRGGWEVEGTEVSWSAAEYAREHYGLELRLGSLEAVRPDGVFDIVTLWHVLEHVPSPSTALAVCRDLLRPGGFLVLALPNDGLAAQSLASAGRFARQLLGRRVYARYEVLRPGVEAHLSHFTPATLRTRLAKSGFRLDALGVDDAAPVRSTAGSAAYVVRRTLSSVTPANFGLEMFAVARRA